MEIGIIEGTTALILSIIRHSLTSSKKKNTKKNMKFAQF